MSFNENISAYPRSILFSPGNKSDLIEKAAKGRADAVCIDLEDAVPATEKSIARENLLHNVDVIKNNNKLAYVRINSEFELISHDLMYLPANTDVVLLPKTTCAEQLNLLSESLDRLQSKAGIIALVETGDGLISLATASHPLSHRVIGLTIGPEDMSLDFHCDSESELIFYCLCELAKIAAKNKVALFGYAGSIANFNDLSLYKENAIRGARIGSIGGLCIHPKQVSVLNQVFTPSSKDLLWARKVVEGFDASKGVANVNGKMIDKPVYLNALRLLKKTIKIEN